MERAKQVPENRKVDTDRKKCMLRPPCAYSSDIWQLREESSKYFRILSLDPGEFLPTYVQFCTKMFWGPIMLCLLWTVKFLKVCTSCGSENRFHETFGNVEHAGVIPVPGVLSFLSGIYHPLPTLQQSYYSEESRQGDGMGHMNLLSFNEGRCNCKARTLCNSLG